jgi:PAS domain S-box-containing protein
LAGDEPEVEGAQVQIESGLAFGAASMSVGEDGRVNTSGSLDAGLTIGGPERWRLLLDAVDEYAIFMLDPIGTVVTWNPGAQRIKGYTADEVLGQHFSIFYTADDISADKPQHHLARAIEHHHCHDEGWRVRKDGTRFWANVVITALFAEDGQVAGFAKITRDETDRNRAEQNARRQEHLIDREHLATELSDTIIRRMFEAGLDLQNALQLITDAEASERVQHAVEILDGTIKDIRNVVLQGDIEK